MPTTEELIKIRDSVNTQDLKPPFVSVEKGVFAGTLAFTSWLAYHDKGVRRPFLSRKYVYLSKLYSGNTGK